MDKNMVPLEAFKAAITRCRWFILATVIVSTLLLFHAYLELFSIEKSQLQHVLAKRLQDQEELNLKKRQKEFEDKLQKQEGLDSAQLATWAEDELRFEKTTHELDKVSVPERSLPFLGMDIPYNDYLPIMGMMLTIFSIGVWLNVRSVWAASAALSTPPDLKQLARLFLTFTGVMDHPSQRLVAKILQYLALWLPAGTLIVVCVMDCWPVIQVAGGKHGTLPPAGDIAIRYFVLGFEVVITILVAQWSTVKEMQIDREFGAAPAPSATP